MILEFLDNDIIKSVLFMSRVNKRFLSLSKNDEIWKVLS